MELLPGRLANISLDAEFFIHLGDIKPSRWKCHLFRYTNPAVIFRQFSAPVFIIPGDNEWNVVSIQARLGNIGYKFTTLLISIGCTTLM
jgi:hypothetical protein